MNFFTKCFFLLFALGMLMFASCKTDKEEITPEKEELVIQEDIVDNETDGIQKRKYKKEMTITDGKGSSVLIKVASDNRAALEEYDEQSFILEVAHNESELNFETTSNEKPTEQGEDNTEKDNMKEIDITILEESLADGVLAYNLTISEDVRWSGAYWFHGYYANRGIAIYDPYYCTYFTNYYWYNSRINYWNNGYVCNGAYAWGKLYCCPLSMYVSSGQNYSVWYF